MRRRGPDRCAGPRRWRVGRPRLPGIRRRRRTPGCKRGRRRPAATRRPPGRSRRGRLGRTLLRSHPCDRSPRGRAPSRPGIRRPRIARTPPGSARQVGRSPCSSPPPRRDRPRRWWRRPCIARRSPPRCSCDPGRTATRRRASPHRWRRGARSGVGRPRCPGTPRLPGRGRLRSAGCRSSPPWFGWSGTRRRSHRGIQARRGRRNHRTGDPGRRLLPLPLPLPLPLLRPPLRPPPRPWLRPRLRRSPRRPPPPPPPGLRPRPPPPPARAPQPGRFLRRLRRPRGSRADRERAASGVSWPGSIAAGARPIRRWAPALEFPADER